jgi:EAL domain-containing protein (putative c-di-GMP-specific phosphodiesterase class I)
MGCEIIQGFYFSKPVPPKDFASFIEGEGVSRKS